MKRTAMIGWLAGAIVLLGALSSLRGAGRSSPEEQGVFCDFEDPAVWDISPEEGFTIERSTEHVTQGAGSLKVVFPNAEYPSINTKKLKQPAVGYDHVMFDVFNPQDRALQLGIRLDDKARKRYTTERTIDPGENRIWVPRKDFSRKLDPDKLAFVVLFLDDDSPGDGVTLYFDNLTLYASARAREAASTSKEDDEDQPEDDGDDDRDEQPRATAKQEPVEAPEPTLPPPLPKAQPQTSGEFRAAVAQLSGGDQPETLVSQGIPFAPGQLRSENDVALLAGGVELPLGVKTLATWPQDGSIRSVLVQARLTPDHMAEPVTVRWGTPRASAQLPVVPVTWETPEAWLQLPAEWLTASEVIGEHVPMYEHDMPDYDDRLRQAYPDRRDDPLKGDIREDGYYSTPHVFYQLYVRSGDLDALLAARRELLRYRDEELILEGSERGRHKQHGETRYIYVEALVDDYLLMGDERSKEVAGIMAGHLLRRFPPAKAFYPKDATNFWTEREAATPFLGAVLYYGITGDPAYRKASDEYMENLYRTQRQWPGRGGFIHNLYAHDSEEGCREDEYGGSPFMTGLLLEPIIEYHRLTGSETAGRSILMALDWLMREGLAGGGDMFLYLTCDMHEEDQDPTPDLNFLVVHGFGYGYRLSGFQRQDYYELSRRLLDRGVEDAFLKNRKHFNQNFRSSGHYFAYVKGAAAAQMAATPEDPRLLLHDRFDNSTGRWASPHGDATVSVDRGTPFAGEGSLKVSSAFPESQLSAGWTGDGWELERHPILRFAYRIPRGVPMGLHVQTQFGDWVALGGTVGQPNEAAGAIPEFVDDGAWHETAVDMAAAMGRVLPGVRFLSGFRFSASQAAGADRQYWIDEFRIGEAEVPQ